MPKITCYNNHFILQPWIGFPPEFHCADFFQAFHASNAGYGTDLLPITPLCFMYPCPCMYRRYATSRNSGKSDQVMNKNQGRLPTWSIAFKIPSVASTQLSTMAAALLSMPPWPTKGSSALPMASCSSPDPNKHT